MLTVMAITPPRNIKDVLAMTAPLTPTLSRRERENKDAATFMLKTNYDNRASTADGTTPARRDMGGKGEWNSTPVLCGQNLRALWMDVNRCPEKYYVRIFHTVVLSG
jgi:hypothetical protein